MFDVLVRELSERYGLGDRGRDLFALLVAYIHNDRRGGFGGFIEGFREQGHGDLLSSWFGNPDADGLNASDVGTVFGQGLLNDWGNRLGVSRATLAAAIAGVLPRLVAEMTPGGRIPGGFSPPASPPVLASSSHGEAPGFFARPGVDGLVASGGAQPPEIVPAAPNPLPAAPPVEAQAHDFAPSPVSEPPVESPAVRSPIEARSAAHADTPALDPNEQRLADMAAAFDRPAGSDDDRRDMRPPGWRPAVHPPKRSGGLGRVLVWLILLALLGAAGWYAWQQGLLDPYITQYNLPIQTSQP